MKQKETTILIPVAIAIILPLLFAFFVYRNFSNFSRESDSVDRDFHILVIGKTENNNFLNNVYRGADQVSTMYNAVVELHVPSSKAEESSLESLFEYAEFVKADGVIAYIDEETASLDFPVKNLDIPVVTIGNFCQEIPQISFIGNNYSESGKLLAKTAFEYCIGNSEIYIINSSEKNPNYSNLMNTITVSLKGYSMPFEILEGSGPEIEKTVLNEISTDSEKELILVCLSEEDSIHMSQLSSDPIFSGKFKIISFGENQTVTTYFNKGIINAIVSVDQENTGTRAMKEIFDYKKNNFANSYVYAGLNLKKGER